MSNVMVVTTHDLRYRITPIVDAQMVYVEVSGAAVAASARWGELDAGEARALAAALNAAAQAVDRMAGPSSLA